MQNPSYENEFVCMHENKHGGGTYFHINGFERRHIMTLRHKATRKWPDVATNVTLDF